MSFVARSFPRKQACILEGQVPCNALLARALTLGVSRGILTGRSDPLPALCHVLACLVGRLQKERQDGCLFPITLPVTDGLGENTAGALNALVPVPASGGGWRPCARGLSIRTSLFPYSRVVGSRASDDSHDALSVFEATVVEVRAYDWGGVEFEASTFVWMLPPCTSVRVPLTDILDSLHWIACC